MDFKNTYYVNNITILTDLVQQTLLLKLISNNSITEVFSCILGLMSTFE